jgi:hypothetical protein
MNYRKTSNQDSLRRSQLITTFGVGSIVDLSENRSVMICSPDKWRVQNAPPIHDNRLEEKLGVQYFVTPPDMDDKSNPGGIPAVVFPRWMRCSRLGCGILMPLKEWRERARLSASYKDFDVTPYCFVHHNASLVPSRFVVACGKGHIDDFPYVAWVHRKRADGTCVSPQLRYKKSSGSSLESIRIECTGCNTTESMAGSFKKDNLKFHECSGSVTLSARWKTHRPKKKQNSQKKPTASRSLTHLPKAHPTPNVSISCLSPWNCPITRRLYSRA